MSRHVRFTLTTEQLAEIAQAIDYSLHPEVGPKVEKLPPAATLFRKR